MNFPAYRKWYMSLIPLVFMILNHHVGGGMLDEDTYTHQMMALFDGVAVLVGSILVRQVPNEGEG